MSEDNQPKEDNNFEKEYIRAVAIANIIMNTFSSVPATTFTHALIIASESMKVGAPDEYQVGLDEWEVKAKEKVKIKFGEFKKEYGI